MNIIRTAVLLILLNVIIGISFTIYENPLEPNYNFFDTTNALNYNVGDSFNEEEAGVQGLELQEEGSWGNAIRMGISLAGIFLSGLIRLPFADVSNQMTSSDPLVALLVTFILFFRAFTFVFTGFAIFKLIKAKDID